VLSSKRPRLLPNWIAEMSHRFFLSSAPADSNPLVNRFFEDLCDIIRIASGLLCSEVVGFHEEPRKQIESNWSLESAEALQDSSVLVCLISPAYCHSERAGKEWQVFESRWRVSKGQEARPPSLAQIIMPVCWTPLEGPVPLVISDLLAHPDRIHHTRPVKEMFKSSGRGEYADFVRTLAHQILAVTEKATLPRLNVLPPMSEVHNAFHLWDESTATVLQSRAESDGYKGFIEKRISGKIPNNEGPTGTSDGGFSDSTNHARSPGYVPRETQLGSRSHTEPERYKVAVVDDEEQIRTLIEECCYLEGLFDVKTYEDSKTILRDLDLSIRQGDEPDAFVIDLGENLQGLELIRYLKTERDVSSSILALSNLNDDGLLQASNLGADAFLQKPFPPDVLMENLEHCAQIGRKCRLRRKGERQPDVSRKRRPVFLSYCSKDEQPADFLTKSLEAKGIGVWYAPDTLEPGNEWRDDIRNGLMEAKIFLPLITDNYATSQICLAEMGKIFRRLKTESHQRPLIIPILYNSPDSALQIKSIRRCLKYHHVTMSPKSHASALTVLFGRIRNTLENR
jgi:CheY-like chemotaxis protein